MFPGLKAIPAFNGAGSTGTGSGGSLSFTFLTSATSTSKNITIPSAALAGDVAVLCQSSQASSSVSGVLPTGWTEPSGNANVTVTSGQTMRTMVSYRVLTAGDGGTSIAGMDEISDTKIMLVFRPSTSIVTTVSSTWNGEATSGNPVSQTVTASGQTTPLIVIAVAVSEGSVPAFTTETPSMTNVTKSNSHTNMRVGYTIYNSSPADQSIDIGDNGAQNTLQSGFLRFT